MENFPVGVYLQPLAVAMSTPAVSLSDVSIATLASDPYQILSPDTLLNLPTGTPANESRLLKLSFASVPVISQSELIYEYQEVGEALGEMTEFDEGDEWWVEPAVLNVGHVATELMANAFPAPRIFSHGSKSVVFNWLRGLDNLYLTVSSDKSFSADIFP